MHFFSDVSCVVGIARRVGVIPILEVRNLKKAVNTRSRARLKKIAWRRPSHLTSSKLMLISAPPKVFRVPHPISDEKCHLEVEQPDPYKTKTKRDVFV